MALAKSPTKKLMTESVERQHCEPEKPLVYEPPDLRGRKHVEKVAGEYRVREDECLADKLQHEEFELHFGKNKDERYRGKIDIKTAKDIYLREVEESGLLSKQELGRLCKDDAWLAQEFNHRLDENTEIEEQKKQATEMQDEEFARYLEAKEKEKLEIERKRRLERRIAQDRAAAERIQRELDEQASSDNEVSNEMQALSVQPSSQKGGWDIDLEVGATAGARTKYELQELRDAEIARRIQLEDTEKEQKRQEEERDRKIAMKLQKQEAEHYKREKERRRLEKERQEQLEKERQEQQTTAELAYHEGRKKSLQCVDATGKSISSHGERTHSQRHGSTSSSSSTPNREGSDKQRKSSNNRVNGHQNDVRRKQSEPIYLQAVDATGTPIEQTRSSSVKSKEETVGPRLIDDQRALQSQMRQIDAIGIQGKSRESKKKKNSKRDNPEVFYDTPENHHYNNVAVNIDPTYSSIDSLQRPHSVQSESIDDQGDIRSIQVIQNVKRQPEDTKKKKKWYSKKEKSK